MIRIKMQFKRAIWTSFGREKLYETTYSDGVTVLEWYIVHDHSTNPFQYAGKRTA